MRCIIVDTSSILFGFSNHVDVFEKIEWEFPECVALISKGVITELEKSSKSRKQAAYAKAALLAVERHKLEISRSTGYVDDWIASESAKRRCLVCTNDIGLKARLKRTGIGTVSLSMNGRLR